MFVHTVCLYARTTTFLQGSSAVEGKLNRPLQKYSKRIVRVYLIGVVAEKRLRDQMIAN